MAEKLDATVENVPCSSTTGGSSERHCGSLTPAIPTAGSAVPAVVIGVGVVGVGVSAGVGAVAETGCGGVIDSMVVGSVEGLDPAIVGTPLTPDSASDEGAVSASEDEGAAGSTELGVTAGAGSAEHPTTRIVISAAAAGIASGQRDRRMRMTRQR